MSVQEMAVRNRNKIISECRNENPNSHRIIDVDCEYDNGKFVMSAHPVFGVMES